MVAVFLFLLVLAVLVLVHEAGHALTARLIGCRVEEFGVGFPPRLFARRVGETVYSLNVVPLGGFVRITGEDGEARDDTRSFATKPRLARALVLLAGVVMNLVLAVVLFALIAGIGAPVPLHGPAADLPLTDARVQIVDVSDNPVLRAAGVQPRDIVVRVGDRAVKSAADAAEAIRGFAGSALTLAVQRDGDQRTVTLKFPEPHVPGEAVGLALLDVATYRVPWTQAPGEGVRATVRTVRATGQGFARLFHDAFVKRVFPKEVAGPVGIAAIVGAVGRQGVLPLMELTAVLSVNLALLNALPIPALDGGRVLFVLFELVGIRRFRGRPERLAHAIGFALLIALIMVITVGDIRRLFTS